MSAVLQYFRSSETVGTLFELRKAQPGAAKNIRHNQPEEFYPFSVATGLTVSSLAVAEQKISKSRAASELVFSLPITWPGAEFSSAGLFERSIEWQKLSPRKKRWA
jgi:hypothetical protein